jgi:DNA polymerase III subunit gamma/tau
MDEAATEFEGGRMQEGGEYVVIARRYRPQTFSELIGQQHVAKALEQAITSDRVGHAYLFTGARGVGKTSAARILAKALNCETGPTPTPCGVCDVCRSVASGNDVDVLEIDGASNRGIDEIRQLRQNVAVRPSRSRFKIYIIDEVHMLTKEAFNALLKTLEEPPEHVKFIFATTEANKIPITILSRCQRFDFAGIDMGSIQTRLTQIAAAEGVELEPEAAQILASRAAGSMRDSQSLLEQLLSIAEKRITGGEVHALLGTAPVERLSELVSHLVTRNAAAALAELDAAIAGGVDVGQLLDQLLGYFRDVMAITVGCPPEQMLYALPSQASEVASVGQQLGLPTVLAMVQILDQTAARLRTSLHGRTLVEMAVVRICEIENLDDLASLVAELRGQLVSAAPARPASPAPAKKNIELKPVAPIAGPIAALVTSVPVSAPTPSPASLGTIPPLPVPPEPEPIQPPPTPKVELAIETPPPAQIREPIPPSPEAAAATAIDEPTVGVPPADEALAELPESVETNGSPSESADSVLKQFQQAVEAAKKGNGAPQSSAPRVSRRQQLAEQMKEVGERPFVQKALELFDVPAGQFRYAPPDDGVQ